MIFLFKQEKENKAKEFYEIIDFDFIKCIAIIELYLKEQWIEPMEENTLPYSLLYHQTMSYLFGIGSCTPKELASNILTLTPFKKIGKEDYKQLLKYLIEKEEIEKDEEGNLLIGMQGERKVNSFQFFSVFTTQTEYSVKEGSQEIGTIQELYMVGQQFALAGFTWKVLDINEEKRQIFVKKVGGVSKIAWNDNGDFEVHTKVLKKMKQILNEEEEYRYLDNSSKQRLQEMRMIAQKANILNEKIVTFVEGKYGIFSWIGTKEIVALSYSLKQENITNSICYKAGIPIFILVTTKMKLEELKKIFHKLKSKEINKEEFEIPDMVEKTGKYNYFIPKELLKKQYIQDCIDVDKMQENM